MNEYDKVFEFLEKYKSKNSKVLKDGTQLIFHAPHIAPEAYLHIIFPPLNTHDLVKIENLTKRKVPIDYKNFLLISNGLSIFSGSLTLDGLRKNYNRTNETRQPFSLEIPNVLERLADSEESYFYIGGYKWDGSLLYIDSTNNKVFRCLENSSKPINQWFNFKEFIISEFNRLSTLFDENGIRKKSGSPTSPE
jgi:hypothetical protein